MQSAETKCREVFDGSSKSSTGISLNEGLLVGSTLLDTLYSIVLWFRLNEIVVVADITKMYHQIWVHPAGAEDRHLQRIFWKGETDSEIQPFELTTVT